MFTEVLGFLHNNNPVILLINEIKGVVKKAFDRPGKNKYFNEWEFADKVRSDSGLIPELCLVATINKDIIGYVLL
ncbi:hypothetical protein GOQ29_06750 [Clostridium sp. D2Q-14]|uniref:hypothetical protein n=1 Tax=Anaeromonas gelatinilytica TaxID=2683194 RepID=UPI00193B7DB5|nr:hypothetical protein [Anaeromonas gelatinilytica]MBS4535315.1 hypothetical protein [Anaeromonas gelatinilytica]